MNGLKVIKNKEQYRSYVSALKKLWKNASAANEDERELLEVLIEKWERDHQTHADTDPVELLKFLMENHNIDASALSVELDLNKATISKILNRRKGMSKYVIRRLSEIFKVSQEAFNRDYALDVARSSSKPNTPTKSAKKKPLRKKPFLV
jgi:HTH-type transcriptional regulator/antitoxin HigA